ncbi:amidohydrolase family protein [Acidobacteriota bacterium]
MKFVRISTVIVLAVMLGHSGALAKDPDNSVALKGATIHTAIGPPIPNGTILLEKGKITAVGANVPLPPGIKVIDVSGKVITPGFIDTHSHLGTYLVDANEMPMPYGPENRAIDGMHMDIPDWYDAVKGGTTVIVTGPGSGERMGGQSITIKTFGKDLKKRILKESGELKMAVNARDLTFIPEIHSKFLKAREYMKAWEKYESGDKKGNPPKRDLAMEALSKALTKEEPVRVHALFANDMMSFLKMKDELGFDLQFIHSDDAFNIAEELAKRDVPCICEPLSLHVGVSEEVIRGNVILHEAGVKVALHSDHPVSLQKTFRLSGSLSIRYGLSEEATLKAMTINPAEIAKVQDRVGSLEKGKDADLVVFNGPWYELKTRVDMVFVDGVLAYERTKDEKKAQETE